MGKTPCFVAGVLLIVISALGLTIFSSGHGIRECVDACFHLVCGLIICIADGPSEWRWCGSRASALAWIVQMLRQRACAAKAVFYIYVGFMKLVVLPEKLPLLLLHVSVGATLLVLGAWMMALDWRTSGFSLG